MYYDVPDYYEPEVTQVIERFVGPGDLAIDAGASVGYFTCLLSRLVGEKGFVFAFEPNLESYKSLEKNTENLLNVKIFQKALWSRYLRQLQLWSVEEIGYSSVCRYVNHDASFEMVEAWKLDCVLPERPKPRFIKIDCELAEYEILVGAQETLKKGVDCVILEFNYNLMRQNAISDHVIRDLMADLGYDMFLINIGDEVNNCFSDPVRVDRAVEMEVRGTEIHHMNVMFSTEAKVREKWPKKAVS